MKCFDRSNQRLRNQFDHIAWLEESGLSPEELEKRFAVIMENKEALPVNLMKASVFDLLLRHARIAIDRDDIFQDKLYSGGLMAKQRLIWHRGVIEKNLCETDRNKNIAHECGCITASADFGHTSPNTQLLLQVGFPGILEQINVYSHREGLTQKQRDFYLSCKIYLEAIIHFIGRLAAAIAPESEENAKALTAIAEGSPRNIYEAMQLLIVYFFLHEYVAGTRIRTLGRLDVLLYPFYQRDLENGTFTKDEIKEMIKFFFHKFWAAKVPFDLPLCLGGIDEDGNEVTNALTYLLVETYNELDIHSPKIHIRVSEQTPADFIKLVLKCIRGGNSSFVFLNDNTVIKSLLGVGVEEKDACNYVPIGCYEPAVWGKEIGCTDSCGVNLAKAVELAVTNGMDFKSGRQVSIQTGQITTYEEFLSAVKAHITFLAESSMNYVREIEKYYGEVFPDPLMSATYDESLKAGIDVYEGGARYNNSSCSLYFIGTLVDSVCAVKRLVFEDKRISFPELCEVLKQDWNGNEKLRLIAKSVPEKYGNHNAVADAVTKELTQFCTSLINNQPNSRGGVFKASMFTIDRFVEFGIKTMATSDGRKAGEVLSKNFCASVGMDKNGVTALIGSATAIDHTSLPNGAVLDIMLHPSAVGGEEGLEAFYSLLKTYIAQGGMALHGNVFNPEDLKKAQKDPERYKNLQVRVCGWNAYFVNLSKIEQDCFIKQAENYA